MTDHQTHDSFDDTSIDTDALPQDELNTPPKPLSMGRRIIRTAGYTVAIAGGFLVLVSLCTPSVSGATRSSRIQWHQQKQQMAQDARELTTDHSQETPTHDNRQTAHESRPAN